MKDEYQTLECTAQVPSSWNLTVEEIRVLEKKISVAIVLMLPDRLWSSASERFRFGDPPIIECESVSQAAKPATKSAAKQAKKKKK